MCRDESAYPKLLSRMAWQSRVLVRKHLPINATLLLTSLARYCSFDIDGVLRNKTRSMKIRNRGIEPNHEYRLMKCGLFKVPFLYEFHLVHFCKLPLSIDNLLLIIDHRFAQCKNQSTPSLQRIAESNKQVVATGNRCAVVQVRCKAQWHCHPASIHSAARCSSNAKCPSTSQATWAQH